MQGSLPIMMIPTKPAIATLAGTAAFCFEAETMDCVPLAGERPMLRMPCASTYMLLSAFCLHASLQQCVHAPGVWADLLEHLYSRHVCMPVIKLCLQRNTDARPATLAKELHAWASALRVHS